MGFLPGHALKLKKRLREFLGESTPVSVKTAPESSAPSLNISAENALSVQQSWSEVRKLGAGAVDVSKWPEMARNETKTTFQA